MRISGKIAAMIERLERQQIPREHLCYELDDHEWQELGKELLHVDISYVDQATFMGMRIRKRSS